MGRVIFIKQEDSEVYPGFSINTFATDYMLIKGIKEELIDGKIQLSFSTIGA